MGHIQFNRRAARRGVSLLTIVATLLSLLTLFTGGVSAATTQFAAGMTAPHSGLILNGAATNPATGKPFRHLWYGDFANGLCRLDPDVDTAGAHSINVATCIHFVANFAQFKPGQLAFDPSTNNIYAVDIQAKTQGIIRLHYLPGGDNGQGTIDVAHEEVLGGFDSGCGIPGNVPDSTAIGPDGNLYIGFKRSGNIVRVISPQTEPLPCANVVVMGSSADQRKDFGLAWIGHDLFGADGNTPWVIANADQCFTAANNFLPCTGTSILGGVIAAPLSMVGDQLYSGKPVPPGVNDPSLNGRNIYFGNGNAVVKFQVKPTQQITANYGGTFQFVHGITIDPSNPGNEIVYAGDDPTNGLNAGQGHWWQITNVVTPSAPGTPTGATATAGDTKATVSWSDGGPGSQPTTSYTVRTLTSTGAATTIPDVTITPPAGASFPPTSATVTGLTNGTSYEFVVDATNAVGSSPFSAPSNVVTPAAATVPGAPTGVSATAGNASAQVAWTAPASNGGSPITGYFVNGYVNGTAVAQQFASASATGITMTGLTNGTTYTFRVFAINAVGLGPPSAASNPVTPQAITSPPDMAVTMSGPASVNPGANATYTMTVTNNGPSSAPQVILTDTLPATGATFVSDTTSQGTCTRGATLSCNLGGMAAGASATITLTLNLTAQATNSASVQANDAAGNPLSDPNPANNSASATTTIATANTTTTDIQVTGSAGNGGPAVGSSDTYTWQVKNGGSQVANGVTFTDTLPGTLTFQTVSANMGTCTGPAAGSAGGTVTCNLTSLPVGGTQIVTINVNVPTAGSIANTGSATFSGTDTNPANNSFTVTIQAR